MVTLLGMAIMVWAFQAIVTQMKDWKVQIQQER